MLERGFERAQQLRENSNPVRQSAIAQARRILQAAGVVDSGIPSDSTDKGLKPETVPQVNLLAQIIKDRLSTPEQVTSYWRTKLQADGERVEADISVPDCDWTAEEIARPMVDVLGNEVPGVMVYNSFQGKEGLSILGRMYPEMNHSYVGANTPITDTEDRIGWFKVEATVDAPNRDTNQAQLEAFAKKQGYIGQRLSTYILVAQAIKDLTGQYSDQGNTLSRLLGSRDEGHVIYVYFSPFGELYAGWNLALAYHYPRLGGRFEEVNN